MAFDGSDHNEAKPDNDDLANEIDDYMRDIKIGFRSRLAHEHVMSSSQTSTNEGGFHKFITFSGQTSTPGLVYGTSTQLGALFISSTGQHLSFVDSAGSTFVVAASGGGPTAFEATGAIGSIPYVTSGGGFAELQAATSGHILVAQGTTAAPSWAAQSFHTFGTWNSVTLQTTQTATSDIIVVAYASAVDQPSVRGETPAGTTRLWSRPDGEGGGLGVYACITMPVRSGDTYLVAISGASSTGASFLSLGA